MMTRLRVHTAVRLAALTTVLVVAVSCRDAPAEQASIAPAALLDRLRTDDAPLVLDVRSPAEYRSGHVPGAVNIPHTELARNLPRLESARQGDVVVYCEAGPRARYAESVLRRAGFSRVRHLEGDMAGWRRNRLPVTVR